MIIVFSSSTPTTVEAFSTTLPTSFTSTVRLSKRGNSLFRHNSVSERRSNDETILTPEEKRDRSVLPWSQMQLPSTIRLSMLLVFSAAPSLLAVVVEPAFAAAPAVTESTTQGVSAITQSALGTSVRSSVVQSAKLVDSVDLKWERFSDSLRDKKKCDPLTNRRLFDNGFRRDGTPRGNPVLGALCDPVPLNNVDENLVDGVLGGSLADAAYESLGTNMGKDSLQALVDKTRVKVRPAFERAVDATTNNSPGAKESSSLSQEEKDEARKRQNYNLEVYSRVRAYGEALASTTNSNAASPEAAPSNKATAIRQAGKKLDRLWGQNLLDKLAGPATAKYEFRSPFPNPDPNIPFAYDTKELTNALGAIEVALQKLQDGGLIGHWEISIPEDDYGEVVTIAVDDDVCLGAQILVREEQSVLRGSPVVAMVRSALEDRAKIPYVALDVFFIDPSTTKNELYNPTQLLVSVRNLGESP